MAEPPSCSSSSEEDPFAKQYNPFQSPLVWCLQDFLQQQQQQRTAGGGDSGVRQHQQHASEERVYVKSQQLAAASTVVEQRRKLPPVLNPQALFTRAAPFGDRTDQAFHAPSNRIGAYLSPASAHAAALLFEEFPQDPHAPRTKAAVSPRVPLVDIRSPHSSSRPLSPSAHGALPAAVLRGPAAGQHSSSPKAAAAAALSSTAVHQLLNRHAPQQQQQQQQHSGTAAVGCSRVRQQPEGAAASSKAAAARAGAAGAHDDAAVVDALLKYEFYRQFGIDPQHVAPYKQEWLEAALAFVPQAPPPLVSQEFYEQLLATAIEETQDDYAVAMKQSILDYVLANPLERQRLGLDGLQPLLVPHGTAGSSSGSSSSSAAVLRPPLVPASHAALVQRQLPPEWHEHVATAREDIVWTLQTLNPNALELSRLWHEHGYASAVRLLDAASPDLLERLPVKAHWFRQHQQSTIEQVKGQLWSHWLPKCTEVFKRLPPVPINNDSKAYYRCVTTLQSNMLRQLVSASLQDYLQLFRQHAAVQPLDPQQDTVLWSCLPMFETELVVQDGRVVFEPSLDDTQGVVLSVLEAAVLAAADLPRITPASSSSGAAAASAASSAAAASGSAGVIPTTGLGEQMVQEVMQEIGAIVAANAAAPQALAALFAPYMFLLQLDPVQHAATFAAGAGGAGAPSLELFGAEFDRLQLAAREVNSLCTYSVRTGLYCVQCRKLQEQLAAAADALVHQLLDVVCTAARDSSLRIADDYAAMTSELGKSCQSGEAVLALKKLIGRCSQDNERLKEEIAANKQRDDFMARFRFHVPDEDFDAARKAFEGPKRFADVLREAGTQAAAEHRQFEAQLKTRRREFDEQLTQHAARLAVVEGRSDIIKREVAVAEAAELQAKLQAAVQTAEEINAQEKMFGRGCTKYTHVSKLLATVEPYVMLWTTINEFYNSYASWMNGPFWKLSPEQVEADTTEAFRKLFKLTKVFAGGAAGEARELPLAVAEEGKAKVAAFQAYLPLIAAVCNAGLRERHWEALAELVGFQIKQDEVTSLKRLLDDEIMEHLGHITELSDRASREFSVEKALDKMTADWQGLAFELGAWKATGTFILKGGPVEEAQVLLEDQTVKSQAIIASPFSKPFLDRLVPWEQKLQRFQSIMDEWLTCQGKWLYLEPIFSAEEIMKQIPREGSAFRLMDASWRSIVEQVHQQPLMMDVADMPGLLETLKECNAQLEIVERGLNQFLETKKMAFPRFYFLSNDELLEVLSEAKDPLAVQPFVHKCFEAVKELVFEPDGTISGMLSLEGERVTFVESVNPAATGAVECWLLEVEGAMKRAMHSLTREALTAYPKSSRTSWILQWPSQLVLSGSQVFWTRDTQEAIQSGGAKGLGQHAQRCTQELAKLVSLVRGNLTKLQRTTCGALVVIDVHARDITASMAADGVEDVRDFRWESQLRYYWEHHEAPPSGVKPQETLVVHMINAEAQYGYEYLGASGRLVITPLTDRCFRTLIGAISMNLVGAPAGPAGTGKTETTKDLSKALAVQCVVFNCSDGLDYKAMGKFFKGLACSGAWACFDEFNRIELEVLSVVAQQVLTLLRAKAAKLKTFIFEGVEIPLKPTCNVFITQNPGYAGRTELPDNLKALFRDVAMMVPDYALIAEIMLFSYGYLDARALARKLVQTYRLCSEQLSSSDWYDFGMRAIVAVLNAAANLKRAFPTTPEDVLMLRAINDVNLPKFLDQDVPLFKGLLSDFFPGVELPSVDYDNLRAALVSNCLKTGLQPLETFLTKAIQLYEMVVVRHGLMLVGASYGMKTAVYKTLAAALTDLNAAGLNNEYATKVSVLNPKSISMAQLYGQEDPISKEWTDGVLPVLFRNAARDASPDRKWLVFDGPVDALWIENLNTVLDDNKKLCLNSGEIISMQGLMNMIFEVADLVVASPATVSRCGMVYVQPDLLGWRPVLQSWLAKLPAGITQPHKDLLLSLFDWLVPPCLRIATKLVKPVLGIVDINLVCSCMRLLESHLDAFRDGAVALQELSEQQQATQLQCYFLFSLVWSLGANTDAEGRATFDALLRKLVKREVPPELAAFVHAPEVAISVPFPEGRLVFDYVFEPSRMKWGAWLDRLEPKAMADPEADYSSIIVPTVDTLRYTYLLDSLAGHHHHCLFVGPTGTAKTVLVKKHLQTGLSPDRFASMVVTFSAQTSANMTQDIIDARLEKQHRGVYGAPASKHMVVFVDDLNMPQVEQYGAQPPIELLRQAIDHCAWHDRKELALRRLQNLQFVAAMGPPGGGRNNVSQRYLRHFNIVTMTAFDKDNLQIIFTNLVGWWLHKHSYGQNIAKLGKSLVSATLEVYEQVQKQLLPTPTKSHYNFNLRDVSKVFQGMTKAAGSLETTPAGIKLWCHEVLRVFYDRLVDDPDRLWLGRLLIDLTEKHFKERLTGLLGLTATTGAAVAAAGAAGAGSPAGAGAVVAGGHASTSGSSSNSSGGGGVADEELLSGLRGLLFADFMAPGAADASRVYGQITDQGKMLHVVGDYMADMNAGSKKPQQLVLFQFALEHVARISAVISQPGGHAMLVGLGGSGRQSLTRLAAYIQGMEVFQVEISKTYGMAEWRDDLRKVLKMAGESNKKVAFLFSDTQIKDESFVEDLSNLINTYEVPNLLGSGDLAGIYENIRPRAKQAGMDGSKDSLYNFFVQEVRRNLHVVFSFSPVGDALRERFSRFPSLVNCTTIDWFTAWPRDALATVATNFLSGLAGATDKVAKALPKLCVRFHEDVQRLSADFLAQQRRHYYVTPTSYLELLTSYKKLLAKKQDEVSTAQKRYQVGLSKLANTETSVAAMQEELIALQPQLEESTRQTEAAMEVIAKETVEADKVKKVVSEEEAVAAAEAAKVQAIKDDCEADLAEALPALQAAVKALDTLTKNDITEVKGMKSPPAAVKLVLEAVCILKGVKPVRMKDAQSGQMVESYWEASKKMLQDEDFLPSLRHYDKDHIDAKAMAMIKTYTPQPDFQPEKIEKVSKAAYGLCCWIRAMEVYDRVAKVVGPKKDALQGAQAQLQVVMSALVVKQAELAAVLKKLADLDTDLADKVARKKSLEAEVELCKVKLDRAEKLIAGLGGEKSRWTAAAERLGCEYVQLTGDVLLAAAQVSYLGAFTSSYRVSCLRGWVAACSAKGVPCSERFKLAAVLGDPVKVRQWNIWGLPKDDLSTENAIAVSVGRRWPLCIDPQGLANKFFKAMEKDSGLLVIKLTDANFLRTLENAIQFGKPVLLENVGEVLDVSLEPLLAKQTFKQGGSLCIKLGDATVEYSDGFRFYITTKLSNPHFAPELCTKVSLLNFGTTPEGLEDQLLGSVVAAERPDLEEEKNRLIVSGASNKRKLKETEDEILRVLSSSSGNILEDEQAVRVLQASKLLADDISTKQRVADETEQKIDQARQEYQPVAHHLSLLYFCVTDLAALDPMYCFSLRWFNGLFVRAIPDSPQSADVPTRLQLLNDHFTFFLFKNVCRSLFEKDKLLFSFSLAYKLRLDSGLISQQELRFLMTGGLALGSPPLPNPAPDLLTHKSWGELCRASGLGPDWQGLATHVAEHLDEWRVLLDSSSPHTEPLPGEWQSRLGPFQRLLLLRALRQDKLTQAITKYVADSMGSRFVEPQPFALEPSFADSSSSTPLIFVLSPGSDPMAALLKFAEEKGVKVESVSLGQGQAPVAQKLIAEGSSAGFWVVLQNCHLAKSFMPALELLCETLLAEGRCHTNFRLWLTSYPSPVFPISVLESGIKLTNEPPKGLRAGLLRTYASDPFCSAEFVEGCVRDAPFRRLLMGLAFFHSVVQERRKFGPIGWSIPYEFNENDLRISCQQLRLALEEYSDIPFDMLNYTAGECNYGGKVTDSHDRITLMTLLSSFYTPQLVDTPSFSLACTTTDGYTAPPHTDVKGYLDYISALPHVTPPGVFGLHDNADISKDLQEAQQLLDGLLQSQSTTTSNNTAAAAAAASSRVSCKGGPADAAAAGASSPPAARASTTGDSGSPAGPERTASVAPAADVAECVAGVATTAPAPAPAAKSREDVVAEIASDILAQLPPVFDLEAAAAAYPQDYFNSMNTVLVQELARFNALLSVMHSSLVSLGQACKGLALMSTQLDTLGHALFDGKVPALWLARSFPSLKPLGSYVREVLERVAFFSAWLREGPPSVFWLSGFFFTQAFLTGAKQNHARRLRVAIDQIDFEFEVMDSLQPADEMDTSASGATGAAAAGAAPAGAAGAAPSASSCSAYSSVRPPASGIYCSGLFLEGARWDDVGHELAESQPKVLYTTMPVIWMQPVDVSMLRDYPHYDCPVYKTAERRGVLSTTGHSTNFVVDIRLPCGPSVAPQHWVKRGVALLTSLSA